MPKRNAPDSGSDTENDEPRGVTGMEAADVPIDEDSWLEALEEALWEPNDRRSSVEDTGEDEDSWLDALEQALG